MELPRRVSIPSRRVLANGVFHLSSTILITYRIFLSAIPADTSKELKKIARRSRGAEAQVLKQIGGGDVEGKSSCLSTCSNPWL